MDSNIFLFNEFQEKYVNFFVHLTCCLTTSHGFEHVPENDVTRPF